MADGGPAHRGPAVPPVSGLDGVRRCGGSTCRVAYENSQPPLHRADRLQPADAETNKSSKYSTNFRFITGSRLSLPLRHRQGF